MIFSVLLCLAQLAVVTFAAPMPLLEERQGGVTILSAAQVSAYKPYTYYTAVASCDPAKTRAWNCGGESVGRLGVALC